MGWWEQLRTFDPPEDRWTHNLLCSRETTYKKEGWYSAKVTVSDSLKYAVFDDIGWDLSSYPDDTKLCAWVYIPDVTVFGSGGYLRYGFVTRFDGKEVYKQYGQAGLSNGWNFLSVPLSDLVGVTSRDLENLRGFRLWLKMDNPPGTVYIDDVYVSTDEEKSLDTNYSYVIKAFKRYDSSTDRNQEYIGVLEPMEFSYRRSLNQIGQADFIFPLDDYDDLPNFYDSVRIYRNGQCVWDGIAVKKEKSYYGKTCKLTAFTSDYVLKKLFDASSGKINYASDIELFSALVNFCHSADKEDALNDWQECGFGIEWINPEGYHQGAIVPQGYTLHREDLTPPYDFIAEMAGKYEFDFEVRPPFCPNFWYPQKGRNLTSVKLYQDIHFTVDRVLENGVDIYTACRALSRGASTSFYSTQSNATAMANYGRLAKLISVEAKQNSECGDAALNFVNEHKDPAVIFDVSLLPGGWIYPWDLGDEFTFVVDGTEYWKRIYGLSVKVSSTEEVRLLLQ